MGRTGRRGCRSADGTRRGGRGRPTGSRVTHDCFARDAWVDETPGTYADLDAQTVHNRGAEWQHPVVEVVSAVAAAGLRIEFLHEHDVSLFPRFGSLVRHEDGFFRFPAVPVSRSCTP